MYSVLQRYRNQIASFLAVVIPLSLMYFNSRDSGNSFLEKWMLYLTGSVQHLIFSLLDKAGGFASSYVALLHVREENERLRRENEILLSEVVKARKVLLENKRLQLLCDFKKEKKELAMEAARVIGKDISPYYTVMRLYLENGDGSIKNGMPVVTNDGVVGRIVRVAADYAEVMLLADSRSRVNVEIPAKGIKGVLKGKGLNNRYAANLLLVEKGEEIQAGDAIITSGYDRVFPRGLEIGTVASDRSKQTGIYFEYEVELAVNFSLVEEVLVITGYQGEEEVGK